MEGLILNEKTEYVTFLFPIFDAIGDDYIRSLNWRVLYPECGSTPTQRYSFEGKTESWITGEELVEEIHKNPDIQWWWGLLQGFAKDVHPTAVSSAESIDLQDDPGLWTNPVSMRDPGALIEIEAFDSSQTVIIAREDMVLEKLKVAFPDYELLSEYNRK